MAYLCLELMILFYTFSNAGIVIGREQQEYYDYSKDIEMYYKIFACELMT